jgi:tetratricopeptide (TPR) repeat protein
MGSRQKYCAILLFLFQTALVKGFSQEKLDALKEYRNGNYTKAISICLQELEQNTSNMDSYVVLCWSLLKQGDYVKAEMYGKKAYDINGYDPRVVEILGESAFYQGQNQTALNYFKNYINLAPEGSRIDMVYYLMGEIYIRQGKYHHADIALSTAIRYVPGDALWWNRLGFAQEKAGEYRSALTAYEHALSLNPQLQDAKEGVQRVKQTLKIP